MGKILTAFVAGLALASAGQMVTRAFADQPLMEAAIAALQQARQSLQEAEPNKGGHRERAMELVDRAIAETQEGIDYAASH